MSEINIETTVSTVNVLTTGIQGPSGPRGPEGPAGEVDPVVIAQLEQQIDNLTDSKLDKADYAQHFRGLHDSYAALIAAIPIGNDGDYAHIKESQNFGRLSAIWSGTVGVWNISGVNVGSNTDEVPEGNQNLYFKVERVLASVISGFNPVNTAISATDTIVQALSKAQGQISNIISNFSSTVRSTLLTGLDINNTAIVATDSFLNAFGKLQGQMNAKLSASTWVDAATLGSYGAKVDIANTKIELSKFNGMIYARGYCKCGSSSMNTGELILSITHADWQLQIPVEGSTNSASAIISSVLGSAVCGLVVRYINTPRRIDITPTITIPLNSTIVFSSTCIGKATN